MFKEKPVFISIWALYVLCAICVILLKSISSPMRIPVGRVAEQAHEKNLRSIIAALPFCPFFIYTGLIIVVGFAAYKRFTRSEKHKLDRPSLYFPPVSMSELLGMSLSIALFPVLIFGTVLKTDNIDDVKRIAIFMLVAIALFPIFFSLALNRSNARNVPHGA